MLWMGESIWYSSFDAQKALDLIFRLFQLHFCAITGSHSSKAKLGVLQRSASLISRLSSMLGAHVQALIREKLSAMLEDGAGLNNIIKELRKTISDMQKITGAQIAYTNFHNARVALYQNKLLLVRKKALCCWRELNSLLLTNFMFQRGQCDMFFFAMFFELADWLRKVYIIEKNLRVAEWFCCFLTETAKKENLLSLIAKFGAYYIEHLRNTDQLSEALLQAGQLQIFLKDEFGDDYLDWLEDAPVATKLYEELSALSISQ